MSGWGGGGKQWLHGKRAGSLLQNERLINIVYCCTWSQEVYDKESCATHAAVANKLQHAIQHNSDTDQKGGTDAEAVQPRLRPCLKRPGQVYKKNNNKCDNSCRASVVCAALLSARLSACLECALVFWVICKYLLNTQANKLNRTHAHTGASVKRVNCSWGTKKSRNHCINLQ